MSNSIQNLRRASSQTRRKSMYRDFLPIYSCTCKRDWKEAPGISRYTAGNEGSEAKESPTK